METAIMGYRGIIGSYWDSGKQNENYYDLAKGL